MHSYLVCDRCSVAIENNDYTWCDHPDIGDEEACRWLYARVTASVEVMGLAMRTAKVLKGYSLCFVCGEVTIDAVRYVGVDAS